MNRKQFIVLCIAIMVLVEGYLATENVDYSIATLATIAGVVIAIASVIIYLLRDQAGPTREDGEHNE